ncbi:hypothetical protein [Mycobacterium sp. NS-7484]|uniref:hypothetical protein n=1 Tax=Mycobacterium sp. NS-7484 TaxID=1834161 RepID=UPI00114DA748|nr:hypothetical protein [Mycobacterium sp. NS-7484]
MGIDMNHRPDEASDDELAEAVGKFDELYGEMESALWCLSTNSRTSLLHGDGGSPILKELVWTIRSWWSVQGASRETGPAMARALVTLEWSPELFEPVDTPPVDGEANAVQRVIALVEQSRAFGAPRREYSLASKVLHLLSPWRIPVYDSFVRSHLGIAEPGDRPEETYARVAHEIFRAARNVTVANPAWMGDQEPRALFRAFDKYYWWIGGGHGATSPQVKDPWAVVDKLGLERS